MTSWGEGAPRIPARVQPRERQAQHWERRVDLGWPTALALLISITVGTGRGAWLLLDGEEMEVALKAGARWFIILICVQIFFYPTLTWAVRLLESILLELIRQSKPQRRPRRERRMPPIVNGRKNRPRRTKGERREGALSGVGDGMRAVGNWLAQGRQPFKGGHYAQQTQVLSAKREPPRQAVEQNALVDLFKMTHHMYHKKLTRGSFELEFPGENGQRWYAEYKRHWLRRHWVDLDGKGAMSWRYEEHELYASDPFLRRVAEQQGFKFPEEGQDALAG